MLNIYLPVFTLLALHMTDSTTIAPPEGVHFNSTNLCNVVVWKPGVEGTRYSVAYAIYGDEDKAVGGQVAWREVKHCTRILQSSCDLSDQTHNLDDDYYARVRAVSDSGVTSNWMTTLRFYPRTDTALGPPQLAVHVNGNILDIKLKGPMRWKNKHMKKERPLKNIFTGYNISVYDNTNRQVRQIITQNQSYRLGSLVYDTMYCISAGTYSQHIPVKSHATEWHCVTTPTDPFKERMLLVILGGLLPSAISLFGLILVSCLVYHYIFGNKQKQPHSTVILPREPEVAIIDFNINIIKPMLQPALIHSGDEWEKLLPTIQPPQHPQQPREALEPQPPSYASQQPPASASPVYNSQSWQSSGSVGEDDVQEVEDEMPPDYGFVVHQPPEESRGTGFDSPVLPQPPVTPVTPETPGTGTNPYKMRNGSSCQSACQSDTDEHGPTLIDWNPSTGILHIPDLNPMLVRCEAEEEEEVDVSIPRDIFSSLVVRQPSQESCEPEDDLFQMETAWQLQVNMEE
ncbi:interleukin-20 receptor subunit alpha [Clupea harengus]|uniref:Interleukin-20 receptor subunit alpha n=1 Tax=Clupea harengus TaxID=7950 RepID=A0A8M1KTU0_CLUHA|nr:interleukin-20 receptor subunit alpha [Clupea harengus]